MKTILIALVASVTSGIQLHDTIVAPVDKEFAMIGDPVFTPDHENMFNLASSVTAVGHSDDKEPKA